MSSVPGRFSGLGSAINNAISRVGQPLLGAVIFIAISAPFYATLPRASRASTPRRERRVRSTFQPLNPPPAGGHAEPGRRGDAGLDRCLPPGDAAGRRALLVDRRAVSWFGLREGPVGGRLGDLLDPGAGQSDDRRRAAAVHRRGAVSRGPGTGRRGRG